MSGDELKVRIFRLRNRLKAKVGGSGLGGPGEFSEDILARVQAEFKAMAEDYPDWVQGHLKALHEACEKARADSDRRKERFSEINEIAHEMKGQGGTFGYPLITTFSDSLYDFTRDDSGLSDNHVEIVKAHIDAMKVVISDRIEGDGGPAGAELTRTLQQAIKKYSVV